MRVTSSMYYNNLFGNNHNRLSKQLFDVNKQISSGLNIQYASDNVSVFTETMQLDNEISSLGQIKKSVESGSKMSIQTDDTLNEFTVSLKRFRTLLISAANGTNSETSLNSIAEELRVIESHFKNLANTSINGQFLFSGSDINTKPINEDGTYNGNDGHLNAFAGSQILQQYNISGAEFFLGEESLVKKSVTTNVAQTLHNATSDASLNGSSTMEEYMGNAPSGTHYFYVNGVKSDGSAFAQKIPMTNTQTVNELLDQIGYAYGNTTNLKLVNVSMTTAGNIVIEDKMTGSSKLDFHIVGATDFNPDATDHADVVNLDLLDVGVTNYAAALATSDLHVQEFIKSGFTQADSVSATGNNIEGLLSDRTQFSVDENVVSSNVAQIDKVTNAFATPSTKLSEVATDTLDGRSLNLTGTTITGAAYDVDINFLAGGSQFVAGGNTYDIFNIAGSTPADEVTYQQLMDVINMVVTENLPVANTSADYSQASADSNALGETSLSYDGKIQFTDLDPTPTQARIALHDSNSGDVTQASIMTFNSNNALTVRDPKTDFFKTIDEMITSVEDYKNYPNASSGTMRNIGIENSIAMIDDLQDHVFRVQSKAGSQSNSLTTSLERTELLEISTISLRSSIIDTDLAEASLSLAQLTTNYQAMLSTVGRVSQLSLVNYL